MDIVQSLDVVQKLSKAHVEITASAAEINKLAGVTPGTAAGSKAVVLNANGAVEFAIAYNGAGSFQPVAVDLTPAAGAGSNVGGDPKFIAPVMGNLLGATLTQQANYLAGLLGHYSVTGVKATTYPAGAVLAGIGDGVTEADGAVVAYIDGDSAQTNAGAAFKVRSNNSTAASGFNYGLDLQDAAHDGYQAVDIAFYKSAWLRMTEDVVFIGKAGVPVDGGAGTGVNVAGTGSICVDYTNGNLYVNANTKASPTWKLVTRAA